MSNMTENKNFTNGTFYNDTDIDMYENDGFENPFDKLHLRIIFTVCYSAVFILCICGNSMVLFAIARSPRLRSMTNFLLGNLAIADFCVGAVCVLPNLSIFLNQYWILGKAMCKIYYYIWNVTYTSSIIILSVIAIERYIAILHPLKARHFMTNKRLVFVQVMIWLVSLIYNIPFFIFYDIISFPGKEFCYPNFEYMESLKWMSLLNLIIWYVVPLLLIGFMYYRVVRTLRKTTVVSALRLRPYPEFNEGAFRRSSTRMSNYNNESSPNKSSQKTEPPSQNASEESQRSDKPVLGFTDIQAFTCGIGQREEISPYELRCLCPSSMSDVNDSDTVVRLFKCRDNSLHSLSARSSFMQSKYKQTYLSSSRHVAKARRKVIRLLIAVVVIFGLCVLPHMMKVLNHYWMLFRIPHNVAIILTPVSSIVLYLNSVLNPFLYAMFSTNFRRSFKETLPCLRQCKKSIKKEVK